jgi:RNA polymerase sigma factor (sigma-70 family)
MADREARPLRDLARPPDFTSFYRSQYTPMVRFAHLLTGSSSIGEEIVQDAFIALSQRWDHVDNPGGYLRTSVLNLSRGYHRRQAVERKHAPRPDRPIGLPEVDEMWAKVKALPTEFREVIVLRFYEDLQVDEIADVLKVPAGTIKSRIHRGLARLREVV